MVERAYQPTYLQNNFVLGQNPMPCTCVRVEDAERDGKQETLLWLDNGKLVQRLSLWGDNFRRCMEKYGNREAMTLDTQKLNGKKFRLTVTQEGGKSLKILECV